MMQLAHCLLHALRAHGAGEIFGIPGDFALPFFRAIETAGILPLYTLSHEPAVGFAADAAARYRGAGLGVAAVTYGAGALNLVNPIAGAYAEKSPVVVISGAPASVERSHGWLLHHQAKTLNSQFEIFREVTCAQARLDDARTAPAEIARVLARCREEARPVYIEMPRDMVTVECAGEAPALAPVVADPAALARAADELLNRVAAARSPVLMVGVEVRRFGLEHDVAVLAQRLGLPVVTTFLGRGVMAETACPPLGTYLGTAGEPELTDLVEASDCLVLLGGVVSDTNFGAARQKLDWGRVIHAVDGQLSIDYHVYPRLPLRDLVHTLSQAASVEPRRGGFVQVAPVAPQVPAPSAELTPSAIAAVLNDLLAQNNAFIVAADVGDCLFTALDLQQTPFVAPGFYASMGFGVPAALGLQAASGRRPIVLVGDGAFQMTGWELGNCRRYGWDPIVVVFNNRSWGMLHAFAPDVACNALDDWHFADIAGAIGGDGQRVGTVGEFVAALQRAVEQRGRFQLIEAMLDPEALSPRLSRFVGAVRKVAQ